jgi:hypothetical protein
MPIYIIILVKRGSLRIYFTRKKIITGMSTIVGYDMKYTNMIFSSSDYRQGKSACQYKYGEAA